MVTMNQIKPSYIWVNEWSKLCEVVEDLERETAIGVDLEADSLFHYHEKVCLLQISSSSQNFLIDPLSVGDVSPLKDLFADKSIRKIFHGADYDIRSLYRDFEIEVNSLFDTQIAATFLGIRETGLANLLNDRFNIIIEKKYQKSDWSKRPLPKQMLDYAAQDSFYLMPLAHMLEDELRKEGRMNYVEEECERLSKVRAVQNDHSPFFLKFKGAGKLDPRSLTVLEAILKFRDEMARNLDRPHFKVLGNSQIKKIIWVRPKNLKNLNDNNCLSPKQISGFGRPLLNIIKEALSLSEDKLLVYPKKKGQRIGGNVAKRMKILKKWREMRASQLGLDPSLVSPNSQIQALAIKNPQTREDLDEISEMKNWQRRVFGDEICSCLKS